ncbi:MAG: isochorismatase family protein, partial [Armatimonadetes bacterium]|nr:isochorismatase family protein [Armatimonadota bacterium]
YWSLPIPVMKVIDVAADDIVFYDGEGYDKVRNFLKKQGVRHILLAGYCLDMCVKSTTCGYENLCKDFNVFIVVDATLATFPAASKPAYATNAAACFAALDHLMTQVSWVKVSPKESAGK